MSLRIKSIFLLLALAVLASVATACASASAQVEPTAIPVAQTWYIDVARFNASAHAGLDCSECHTTISMKDVPDQHPNADPINQDIVATFDYQACQRCHPQEYAAYMTGVHADVQEGKRKPQTDIVAPTCGACHSPHYEPANQTRAEVIAYQVQVCGNCHAKERDSYLQNFHGKAAVNLADVKSAACTDCHGGHDVVSLKQTTDALTACQQCHPDASPNMAGFLIHAEEQVPAATDPHPNETLLLFGAKIFFTLLIIGTLGFFYGHTLLWLVRSAQKRMRGG